MNDHSGFTRSGAGSWSALLAVDLYEAETAGAKWFEAIGGAKFGNCGAEKCSGSHDGSACWDASRHAIDDKFYLDVALDCGSAVIRLV
jgi:hypothetical protein